jgi:adenylate cyclase
VGTTATLRNLLHRVADVGVIPGDTEEERLRKATLTLIVIIIVPLATVWTITYGALGLWLGALAPFSYQILSLSSLLLFARNKNYDVFCFTQLSLILLLPFFMQIALGGFAASSGVILWSFVAPLGALLCRGTRYSIPWFMAFAGAVAISAAIDPVVTNHAAEIPRWIQILFFALNQIAVTMTAFLLLQYFVRGREQAQSALDAKNRELLLEQERSEQLLLNVLPPPIAGRLKSGERLIADRVSDATVLFADIVGFTSLTRQVSPERMISVLNELFSAFDRLATEHGLEKIKTIGDSYMLVGGLPERRPDHVEAVAEMALAMHPTMIDCSHRLDHPLSLRIGIDTGPVVAGVIGQQKFSYDTWGDTVNTASRMANYGTPNSIQVTGNVVERLHDQYLFQSRGAIKIKGKGRMPVYVLRGRITGPATSNPPDRQQTQPRAQPAAGASIGGQVDDGR